MFIAEMLPLNRCLVQRSAHSPWTVHGRDTESLLRAAHRAHHQQERQFGNCIGGLQGGDSTLLSLGAKAGPSAIVTDAWNRQERDKRRRKEIKRSQRKRRNNL